MVSVNTNMGAFVALQALTATQNSLAITQQHVSTGLAVSGPKDNASLYAIAQTMRADVGAYQAVSQSLDRGGSTVDVAIAAGQSVSDLLVEMKQKALAATDTTIDSTSASSLNADYQALVKQIDSVVQNATFNGVSLIDGAGINGTYTDVKALANTSGTSTITVSKQDLDTGGANVTVSAADDLTSNANATTALANVNASITKVNTVLANLGTGSKALSLQKTFVSKLSDSLTAGIGNLVDADMAKESANLQSLQVKQQLGVQALSIANQSPQVLLSLFK